MKLLKRIICLVCIGFSVWTIFENPVSIVGEYPMLMAFLSLLVIFISLIIFLRTYAQGDKMSKPLTILFIVVSIIGGIGILPGMILTGIQFKKAKSNYLIENGTVCKAFINDKISHHMTRHGHESKGFEIHFNFYTNKKVLINSFDVVSEDKFNSVNEGDSVLVIYSTKEPKIVDLIIDNQSIETYNAKIKK
jgi:hypothetical protein